MLIIRKAAPLLDWFWRRFITIVWYVIHNCLSFAAKKQGTEFLTVWSCRRLPYKNQVSCISFSSPFYIAITVWTTWNVRDCMLMASFLWCSKNYCYSFTNLSDLLWVMIQIVNVIEFFLAEQYFDDWRVSIKQQDHSFSRKKKNQVTDNKWGAFQLLEVVISSASGQIHFGWKNLSIQTLKLFWS